MALSTTASRFSFLNDDASDPFEKKKKKASSVTASGAADTSKGKKPGAAGASKAKNANTPANKNTTSGSQQGKKKKPTTNGDANKNVSVPVDLPELHSKSDQAQGTSNESSYAELNNVDDNEGKSTTEAIKKKSNKGKKAPDEKPKDMQWEEWQKRDQQFVTGSFESDLEAALIQSKLEHQKDDTKPGLKSRKNKNKPAAVSLSEFNQMIGCGNGRPGLVDPNWSKNLNGFATRLPPPGLVQSSAQFDQDQDAALMEQFRRETQLEIERERRLEIERSILKSRAPVAFPQAKVSSGKEDAETFNYSANQNSISCTKGNNFPKGLAHVLLEKNQAIAELTTAKTELENKLEDLGSKFKKVCSMLADSQLKDKVKLLRENEKLTQLNTDLNEQVTALHSQLEQEKSKCSSLAADLRKHEYSRKRTQSHNEAN